MFIVHSSGARGRPCGAPGPSSFMGKNAAGREHAHDSVDHHQTRSFKTSLSCHEGTDVAGCGKVRRHDGRTTRLGRTATLATDGCPRLHAAEAPGIDGHRLICLADLQAALSAPERWAPLASGPRAPSQSLAEQDSADFDQRRAVVITEPGLCVVHPARQVGYGFIHPPAAELLVQGKRSVLKAPDGDMYWGGHCSLYACGTALAENFLTDQTPSIDESDPGVGAGQAYAQPPTCSAPVAFGWEEAAYDAQMWLADLGAGRDQAVSDPKPWTSSTPWQRARLLSERP